MTSKAAIRRIVGRLLESKRSAVLAQAYRLGGKGLQEPVMVLDNHGRQSCTCIIPQLTAGPLDKVLPGVRFLGASPGNVRGMQPAGAADVKRLRHKVLELQVLWVLVPTQGNVPASAHKEAASRTCRITVKQLQTGTAAKASEMR